MNHFYRIINTFLLVSACVFNLQSQVLDHSWEKIVHTNDDLWFASDEAKTIAENVLLYQRNIGGWPKNIQMQKLSLLKTFKKRVEMHQRLII